MDELECRNLGQRCSSDGECCGDARCSHTERCVEPDQCYNTHDSHDGGERLCERDADCCLGSVCRDCGGEGSWCDEEDSFLESLLVTHVC